MDNETREKARDLLHRLSVMQAPNVLLQQITMLGEARDILTAALATPPAAPDEAIRTGTVADIPDAELLRRAVTNIVNRDRKQPAWARIKAFGLGSTYSAQLCRRFGIDPETGAALTGDKA